MRRHQLPFHKLKLKAVPKLTLMFPLTWKSFLCQLLQPELIAICSCQRSKKWWFRREFFQLESAKQSNCPHLPQYNMFPQSHKCFAVIHSLLSQEVSLAQESPHLTPKEVPQL